MKEHVRYTPRSDDLAALNKGNIYHEVWQGLPTGIKFTPTESRGGNSSLRYEQGGDYIWVVSSAVQALESNPDTILTVSLRKTNGNKTDAYWVDVPNQDVFGTTLESTIAKTREFNRDSWARREKVREEAKKGKNPKTGPLDGSQWRQY
jgi:hypothetical protein